MSASKYVYVIVTEIKVETDKAFLMTIDEVDYWLPKSQIPDAEDYSVGKEELEIAITEFIAEKNNLKGA